MDPESPLARQILLVDSIATRYHCLPSEILERGDTFDVFIINTALDIQKWMSDAEEAKAQGKPKPPKPMPQEVLMEMLERSKNANKKNRR